MYTCDGVVHIASGFTVIVFSSFYNHQVSREIHTPGQSAGGNQNLEKTLHVMSMFLSHIYVVHFSVGWIYVLLINFDIFMPSFNSSELEDSAICTQMDK